MRVKKLAEGRFIISSILEDDRCPVTDTPLAQDENFEASFSGLLDIIERIAVDGFLKVTSSMSRCVHTEPKIFEIRRGRLRLFYFHGPGNRIVVCTELIVKKTQKVDKQVVKRAVTAYDNYYHSLEIGTLKELEVNNES